MDSGLETTFSFLVITLNKSIKYVDQWTIVGIFCDIKWSGILMYLLNALSSVFRSLPVIKGKKMKLKKQLNNWPLIYQ